MKHFFYLAASLLALPLHGQAQKTMATSQQKTYQPPGFTDPDRMKKIEALFPAIETIYRDYALKNHFPGLAFGLVVDGKLVYSGGTGYTDVVKKTPATPASVFRIASMTKSITAMAILKLRDEGKLHLDDPVANYIPEVAKLAYLTADAPPLTVRNLMTHSGGFPEDNPWGDRQLADTDAELVAFIKGGVSFANVPGVAYEYSNLGFAMLGRIITNVSGKQYQQYITDNILRPLGMTHTEWEYTKVPADQLALGYRWLDGNWVAEPLLHDGSYGAMGGLLTSIEDFSKYVAVHLAAWPPRNDAESIPIKRSSVREMQLPRTFSGFNPNFKFPGGRATPTVSHYAYGLGWVRDGDGREYVAHSGGLPGFGSQWRMMADYGISVIAFANLTYANIGTVNWAVLDALVTAGIKPRQLPASSILNQRKAELVSLLPDWKTTDKNPIFAENFFPDHAIEARRKQAQTLFAKAGKIVRVGELMPENQLRGHFLIEGEQANIDVFFTLTPENPALIQQLDLTEFPKKVMISPICYLIILVELFGGQAQGQTPEALVRAARAQSNRAILNRDLTTLIGTMLPEIQVTAGSGRHLASRDSVQTLFAKTFADTAFLDYVRTTDSIQVSTMVALAAEHGHWVGRWQRSDGIQLVKGTYLAMWRKTEAGWKLRSELFVSLSCAGSKACNQ